MAATTARPSSVSSPTPSQDEQIPHLLSLKVMRLSRPNLSSTLPVYYENTDTKLTEGLDSLTISDLTASHPIMGTNENNVQIRDFGLSDMLKLPSAFGNIYLGENFSTFISINNESSSQVLQVGVKIELQTSSQRFGLADTTQQPLRALDPNQTWDVTIAHEIKELGVHILVCSVHYTIDQRKRHFRKFYKFQVSNPLAVKTKLNNMLDGRVFLEAQLQNVSAGPMFLERMRFEPSEHFQFQDLNKANEASVFGDDFIHPQDIRQYLYMLTPNVNDRISRTTNALGKLDIVWRSYMGDLGRLQTSQLTRKAPLLEDLEVQPYWIEHSAVKVVLETPFKLGIRIKNHSGQNMKLVLSTVKTKMGSVLLSGVASQQVGELSSSGSVETQLEFFPLTPGLQRVGGLKVMDLITGYTKDIDHLCDIFVLSHSKESFSSDIQ
jgi:hypothetical protein